MSDLTRKYFDKLYNLLNKEDGECENIDLLDVKINEGEKQWKKLYS